MKGITMGDRGMAEGSIYEIQFTYNLKVIGYTTSMLYMEELS